MSWTRIKETSPPYLMQRREYRDERSCLVNAAENPPKKKIMHFISSNIYYNQFNLQQEAKEAFLRSRIPFNVDINTVTTKWYVNTKRRCQIVQSSKVGVVKKVGVAKWYCQGQKILLGKIDKTKRREQWVHLSEKGVAKVYSQFK